MLRMLGFEGCSIEQPQPIDALRVYAHWLAFDRDCRRATFDPPVLGPYLISGQVVVHADKLKRPGKAEWEAPPDLLALTIVKPASGLFSRLLLSGGCVRAPRGCALAVNAVGPGAGESLALFRGQPGSEPPPGANEAALRKVEELVRDTEDYLRELKARQRAADAEHREDGAGREKLGDRQAVALSSLIVGADRQKWTQQLNTDDDRLAFLAELKSPNRPPCKPWPWVDYPTNPVTAEAIFAAITDERKRVEALALFAGELNAAETLATLGTFISDTQRNAALAYMSNYPEDPFPVLRLYQDDALRLACLAELCPRYRDSIYEARVVPILMLFNEPSWRLAALRVIAKHGCPLPCAGNLETLFAGYFLNVAKTFLRGGADDGGQMLAPELLASLERCSIGERPTEAKTSAAAVPGKQAAPINRQVGFCVFCFAAVATELAMPCKHLCYCSSCLSALKEESKKDCPLCRAAAHFDHVFLA